MCISSFHIFNGLQEHSRDQIILVFTKMPGKLIPMETVGYCYTLGNIFLGN